MPINALDWLFWFLSGASLPLNWLNENISLDKKSPEQVGRDKRLELYYSRGYW
jgi:hypothetical protein